jgi:CheY-like chemotaxis protein
VVAKPIPLVLCREKPDGRVATAVVMQRQQLSNGYVMMSDKKIRMCPQFTHEQTAEPDRPAGVPLRVVIADDDHDTVLTLSSVLREAGHETRGVYRGDKVIEAIIEFAADAALIDVMMPGMTGLDVARGMRQRYGTAAPVLIAVTAWSTSSDRILARAAGFDEHVGKPYDPSDLVLLLEQRVRERRARAEKVAANFTFGGATDTLHSRLLRKLADILGSTEAVRRALMVPTGDMSRWITGAERMPASVFVKATDLLIKSTPAPTGSPPLHQGTLRPEASDEDPTG